jgi:hypothetical protein
VLSGNVLPQLLHAVGNGELAHLRIARLTNYPILWARRCIMSGRAFCGAICVGLFVPLRSSIIRRARDGPRWRAGPLLRIRPPVPDPTIQTVPVFHSSPCSDATIEPSTLCVLSEDSRNAQPMQGLGAKVVEKKRLPSPHRPSSALRCATIPLTAKFYPAA